MIAWIRDHLAEIRELRVRFRVRRLELFGSAVDPARFSAQSSDLDFLVQFEDLPLEQYADVYFGLLEALEKLSGRRVDLVMPDAIRNPYFRQQIDQAREVVYAA